MTMKIDIEALVKSALKKYPSPSVIFKSPRKWDDGAFILEDEFIKVVLLALLTSGLPPVVGLYSQTLVEGSNVRGVAWVEEGSLFIVVKHVGKKVGHYYSSKFQGKEMGKTLIDFASVYETVISDWEEVDKTIEKLFKED